MRRFSILGVVTAALCACATPPTPLNTPAASDEEVTIDGGRAPLHAAWRQPRPFQGGRVVLILPGSGPTDRDGNSIVQGIHPNTYRMIADALAANGIASLRIDKRGVGASAAAAASEQDLRFTTYVDDTVAWMNYAWRRSGVRCVSILGHSEGAQVAALAAARVRNCGLISVSGEGHDIGETIVRQVRAGGAPPEIVAQVQHGIDELRAGRTIPDPPAVLMSIFRPSVQPYMISWIALSPTAAIAAVRAPVLIIQGDADVQVSVDDARLLAAARPGAGLVILSGVNHVLKQAPADRAGNIATYADPNLPLAPSVIPPIVSFVRSR